MATIIKRKQTQTLFTPRWKKKKLHTEINLGQQTWKAIFSFFGDASEMCYVLSQVRKAWSMHNLCDLFTLSYSIRNSSFLKSFPSSLKCLQVCFDEGSDNCQNEVEKHRFYQNCAQFKVLDLEDVVRLDISQFTNCKSLMLTNCKFVKLPPNLVNLSMLNMNIKETDFFAGQFPYLQSICLEYDEYFSDDDLLFLQFYPSLSHLSISRCPDIQEWRNLIHCKAITHLNIHNTEVIKGIKMMSQLIYLEISFLDFNLEDILQLPNLKVLVIHVSDEDEIIYIPNPYLPNLQNIVMVHTYEKIDVSCIVEHNVKVENIFDEGFPAEFFIKKFKEI